MNNAIPIVRKTLELCEKKSGSAIDLGCGHGRNALFMAQNGFNVTAVDNDLECINSLASNDSAKNITAIHSKLETFIFPQKYDVIICTFVLHFLDKTAAKELVKKALSSLKDNGILTITLIKQDGRLTEQELMQLVEKLKVELLAEKIIHDEPHEGANYPHDHDVVFFIGKK